jgi:hypothetical protein
LQLGKASDSNAITWGGAIGGRTATVAKKKQAQLPNAAMGKADFFLKLQHSR